MLRTTVLALPVYRLRRGYHDSLNRELAGCNYLKKKGSADNIGRGELAIVGNVVLIGCLMRDHVYSVECLFPVRAHGYVAANEFCFAWEVLRYALGMNSWLQRVQNPD
jgi:hypothetical protein